jgi:uncharacterized protein GlcG (DUF336 family)
MPDYTLPCRKLTHTGTLAMLQAAAQKACDIGQPQCIVIVDASGETLGELRMTGAKYLSRRSALAKAQTAASIGAPSHSIPEAVRPQIAAATQGAVTGLGGGFPIIIDGHLLGGIGVGSGSPDQDAQVALAALGEIEAQTAF